MSISVNDNATDEVVESLLKHQIPTEWESDYRTFINYCDCSDYFVQIVLEAFMMFQYHQVLNLPTVGASKKENSACYFFEKTTHNFPLSKDLYAKGWRQVHCTVRRPQIQGLKAKKTYYPVHFWTKDGRVILAKVKIEGKYVPKEVVA